MIAARWLAMAALCCGCEGEFAPRPVDAGVAAAAPALPVQRVLLFDGAIAHGAASLLLELIAPRPVQVPANAMGAAFLASGDADVRVEAHIRYLAASHGGQRAGEFVPYLRPEIAITNQDDGRLLRSELLPMVGTRAGLRYASHLRLIATVGAAASHYAVELLVRAPARLGDADATLHSPGVLWGPTLTQLSPGSLFSTVPPLVRAHFSLDDLRGNTAANPARAPPQSGSGTPAYIPP